MDSWSSDELNVVDRTDELRVSWRRRDGTLSKPVIIWVVRLGDDLYVRSVHGRGATWYRGTQGTGSGHIECGSVSRDVSFGNAGGEVAYALDAAYRAKYRRYATTIVESTTTTEAREATVRLTPR
jgi:hypothetical protein